MESGCCNWLVKLTSLRRGLFNVKEIRFVASTEVGMEIKANMKSNKDSGYDPITGKVSKQLQRKLLKAKV